MVVLLIPIVSSVSMAVKTTTNDSEFSAMSSSIRDTFTHIWLDVWMLKVTI